MESWYDFNSRVAISCAGKSRSARPEKNAEFGKLGPHFSKFVKNVFFLTIRQKSHKNVQKTQNWPKMTKIGKMSKKAQNGHFALETGRDGKLGSVAFSCARERSQRAKYKMPIHSLIRIMHHCVVMHDSY